MGMAQDRPTAAQAGKPATTTINEAIGAVKVAMNRGSFVRGAIFALLALPLAAEAQPAAKMSRIALLDASSMAARVHLWDAFRQGLHEFGYVEGHNLTVESRWADGKTERLPGLAAELVRLKPELIMTAGVPATLAAKQATTTIPIVMTGVGDPVPLGLVASLARPGGNITGLTNLTIELAGKRVELLKEVVPKVSRVAVSGMRPIPRRSST